MGDKAVRIQGEKPERDCRFDGARRTGGRLLLVQVHRIARDGADYDCSAVGRTGELRRVTESSRLQLVQNREAVTRRMRETR